MTFYFYFFNFLSTFDIYFYVIENLENKLGR